MTVWIGALVLAGIMPSAAQESRVALVIGVANYSDARVARLGNPLNDSRALAGVLRERGFEVRELADPGRREMMAAINAFAAGLPRARVGLFYFSGHGVQLNGANYLLPGDAAVVERREDLADEAIGVSEVAARMTAANAEAFHLLIIDACRDDPYPSVGKGLASGRGLTSQSASGVMILQAAGSNQVALDKTGDGDPYGLFTGELLKAIRIPGLPVRGVIQTVRDAVRQRAAAMGERQTPALYDEAVGDFVFTPGQAQMPPQIAPRMAMTLPPLPPPVAPTRSATAVIRDCPQCPEMVLIPAGSFQMGIAEPESRREGADAVRWDVNARPPHAVRIGQAFYLGRYHVTRGQYAAFARATGRGLGKPDFDQTDDHPVVEVNWNDAVADTELLGRRTGQRYRLPTEAEWEYAARAGMATARYWGESADPQCRFANGFDQTAAPGGTMPYTAGCQDGYANSSPVGRFSPNGFGLYDMLGNAGQWVQDCWSDSYRSAPANGSSYETKSCSLRVVRGGSWSDGPWGLRAGIRDWANPGNHGGNIGFRVARALSP